MATNYLKKRFLYTVLKETFNTACYYLKTNFDFDFDATMPTSRQCFYKFFRNSEWLTCSFLVDSDEYEYIEFSIYHYGSIFRLSINGCTFGVGSFKKELHRIDLTHFVRLPDYNGSGVIV